MKNKFQIIFSLVLCLNSSIYSTPLDDYVNSKDDHYKYEILKVEQFSDYKLFYINMTSQKWQDEKLKMNSRVVQKYFKLISDQHLITSKPGTFSTLVILKKQKSFENSSSGNSCPIFCIKMSVSNRQLDS
ncbi:autocrine proliferation repressor A-like [Brachionus plicatilis]|uniref:Autocrine proliferation repressor A-like n=1 Tax=Brachionus plicatilis TaxID=10195 RepID=A0A3M7PMJ2_BRAPC|nr:autocrine proliferation repressor A-like [Brachionus plicatilis]